MNEEDEIEAENVTEQCKRRRCVLKRDGSKAHQKIIKGDKFRKTYLKVKNTSIAFLRDTCSQYTQQIYHCHD